MAMNLRLAFQSFRESGAPRLDDCLLGLPLVPIAGGKEGGVPASLEFGAVLVRRCGHGHSCCCSGSGKGARGQGKIVGTRRSSVMSTAPKWKESQCFWLDK